MKNWQKIFRLLSLAFLVWGQLFLPLSAEVFAGEISESPLPLEASMDDSTKLKTSEEDRRSRNNQQRPLLKGQVTYLVPRGTPIKLKLASVPTSGLKLGNRDLEGKLPPAQLGQEITAKTTEDIFVDNNNVIPQGTIFHGHVAEILPPRRVGRPGSLVMSFDYLMIPNGKRFAFKAEANNFRPSTFKSKAKGLGLIAAHTAGGAIVGALIAYQIFGLQNTIAAHGYNVAGGAAAGALAATAYALLRRGPQAVLEPGDDLNMEIDTDLLMPAATSPTPQKPNTNLAGFKLEILKSKLKKDGLDGHYLYLSTRITNNTQRRLNSLDLYLLDDNGQRFPVCAGSEEETELLFSVEPRSIKLVQFDLQLEYPKLKRQLVWIDRSTQNELFRQRLP